MIATHLRPPFSFYVQRTFADGKHTQITGWRREERPRTKLFSRRRRCSVTNQRRVLAARMRRCAVVRKNQPR